MPDSWDDWKQLLGNAITIACVSAVLSLALSFITVLPALYTVALLFVKPVLPVVALGYGVFFSLIYHQRGKEIKMATAFNLSLLFSVGWTGWAYSYCSSPDDACLL